MLFPTQIELFSEPLTNSVKAAVEKLAESGIEERGAIYTRYEVVDFILDLVEYTSDKPLYESAILEPSFGSGDFLFPVVERLLKSVEGLELPRQAIVSKLSDAIRAVELHRQTYNLARSDLAELLFERNFESKEIEKLLNSWLSQDDFLLKNLDQKFLYVVGNPPYVRHELIPEPLIAAYRDRFQTIYDRADLYVPFIEKSLSLLEEKGHLGLICSDRWMKNRYGKYLRSLVAQKFHLQFYIDMTGTPAFHSDVIAYPAITVITKDKGRTTRLAHRPLIDSSYLKNLSNTLLKHSQGDEVKEVAGIVRGAEPWILDSHDRLEIIRKMEANFPTLEEVGCKVGIGVATGADKVFIVRSSDVDIEDDRKIPLVMTKDILSGEVDWRGFAVINPFNDDGTLIELANYPKLEKYLEKHGEEIKERHVSRKNPKAWYRTIDRIYPAIAARPKILIPDIKGEAHIVYEDGKYYPHHNLYYIVSNEWDLKALQTVLKSGIARIFIDTYSTKMHGGFLRFQAQYLRRIRLPKWKDVKPEIKEILLRSCKYNPVEINVAVAELYGLDEEELRVIGL